MMRCLLCDPYGQQYHLPENFHRHNVTQQCCPYRISPSWQSQLFHSFECSLEMTVIKIAQNRSGSTGGQIPSLKMLLMNHLCLMSSLQVA
jgi:hypothetical protein